MPPTYTKNTFDGWELLVRTGQTLPELTDVFSSETGVNLFHDNFRNLYNISSVAEVSEKDSGTLILNSGFGSLKVVVKGQNSAYLFTTNPTNNYVGIGKNVASQKLNVQNNILIDSGWLASSFNKRLTISKDTTLTPSAQTYILQYYDTGEDSAAITLFLKDGVPGQTVTFYVYNKIGGSGSDSTLHILQIMPDSPVGYQYIKFNNTGQNVTLQFLNGKWFIISIEGTSLPTIVGSCCSGIPDLCDSTTDTGETVSRYTLIQCDDSTQLFTTSSDLSDYVGKYVAIENNVPREGTDSTANCWKVEEGGVYGLSRCNHSEQPSITFLTRTDLSAYVGKWVVMSDDSTLNRDSTAGSWYVSEY